MSRDPETTALANSAFAKTLLHRATEIVAGSQPSTVAPTAYTALEQARNEITAQEPQNSRKQITYGFQHLSVDLVDLIRQRHPQYADVGSVINHWSREQDPETVVKTLRESAVCISNIVAERTRTAARFELMPEQERTEYLVMQKAIAFLQQQGLAVLVDSERENPEKDPIDYWAYLGKTRWAFEITTLRKDAPESRRKAGAPRSNKSITEQLEQLPAPIPKVPDDAKELQSAFNKAIEHGNQPSKINALSGAKYCLLIHNQQFLFEPSWPEIDFPDFKQINVVLILHSDDLTPTQVWEAIPTNGFGKPVKSQNISDLADIAEFVASSKKNLDREAARAAWAAIPELDVAEILQAIQDL